MGLIVTGPYSNRAFYQTRTAHLLFYYVPIFWFVKTQAIRWINHFLLIHKRKKWTLLRVLTIVKTNFLEIYYVIFWILLPRPWCRSSSRPLYFEQIDPNKLQQQRPSWSYAKNWIITTQILHVEEKQKQGNWYLADSCLERAWATYGWWDEEWNISQKNIFNCN